MVESAPSFAMESEDFNNDQVNMANNQLEAAGQMTYKEAYTGPNRNQ